MLNADFIESAVVPPGTPFVTRPAPGVGTNLGGGIEVSCRRARCACVVSASLKLLVARDYYGEARSMAGQLRADAGQLEQFARAIDDTIAAGFAATEILMGLRVRLGELLLGGSVSEQRRSAIEDLLNGINEALQ